MHASNLAEIAGWLTVTSLKQSTTDEIQALLAEQYWNHSKARTDNWNKALRMFADDLERDDDQHNPWPAISIVAEEIIVSEMLTRLWSASISQNADGKEAKEFAAIAHAVLIGHVEARNRAFKILLQIPHWAKPTAEKLTQLGKSIERWTDLLLSHLPDQETASIFAFCQKRLADFASDQQSENAYEHQAADLLLVSLAADLNRMCSKFPANPDLNRQIASGVISYIGSDPFAKSVLPKSAWMLQVDSVQHNTEGLIQQLIAAEKETLPVERFSFSEN